MDLIGITRQDPSIGAIAQALDAGRRVVARGAAGSSTAFIAGALAGQLRRPVVLITAHLDDADEAQDEMRSAGLDAIRLPALEGLPGETGVSIDLFAHRLAAVQRLASLDEAQHPILVCPIQALMQAVPTPHVAEELIRDLRPGGECDPVELVRWLDRAGYSRVDAVEEVGEYALRGGILDVFPPAGDAMEGAVRIDFFGDEIEKINEVDLDTMGSGRALDRLELVCTNLDTIRSERDAVCFLDLVPNRAVAVIAEPIEVTEQGRGYFERVTDARGVFGPPAVLSRLGRLHAVAEIGQFSTSAASADTQVELPVSTVPELSRDVQEAMRELIDLGCTGQRVIVACQNDAEHTRFTELLAEARRDLPVPDANVGSAVAYVHRGFGWGRGPTLLIPYHELLHRFHARRRSRRLGPGRAMDTFLEIAPGDYVVHAEHGICRFVGLRMMTPRQPKLDFESQRRRAGSRAEQEEYLTLQFAGGAKLHVPATKIDQIQKYIGGFRGRPPLSTLGGVKWQHQKKRVSESVRDLASELLRVRAAREHMPGIRYPQDTAWQREFEAEFPYEETEDQLAALAAIKRDMQAERPMDRLICGDVGFGKTELAVRAAFKAVEFGKQVAVLVPTTVLAEQHESTFRGRFADYPFRVESLSRFKPPSETRRILEDLRTGRVDIIIGTHRLLSGDVRFADLGLVVIDEEQRFGVEHKEKLLSLRMTVDVLTLSATPIPRTLHMSMLGLRDISSLATPPLDRQAVVTEVIPYNEHRVARAIARELARDGQVFVVHNRIHNIRSVADEVQRLAGEASVVVGHGQMPSRELERVMLLFMRRQADVLVSTTIIESGIDIPTANTMIIRDADRFGLAELHQLRGRVGRYKHRAYCYLLLPVDRQVQETAVRRLRAIEQFSMLGAGFKIAMRDLEIRGAGNLLGPEQSGHIAAVGYEMYCQLLERAVRDLTHQAPEPRASLTSVEIGVSGRIPKAYVPSDVRRLEAYRRVATATSAEDLSRLQKDLESAYGPVPKPVQRLLELAEVRIGAAAMDIRLVVIRESDIVFRTTSPQQVAGRLRGAAGMVRVLAPKTGETHSEVYYRPPPSYLEPDTLLALLRRRLSA